MRSSQPTRLASLGSRRLSAGVRLPMKIGTAAILLKAQAQRIAHRFRRRIGDASKRSACCGPMPAEYSKGSLISAVPDLAHKLDKVSELWAGHSAWYAC